MMKQLKFTALNFKKMSLVVAIGALSSCTPDQPIVVRSADFQSSVDQVTRIMVHDIFSPPVASRIYAYPNIAAYEILAQSDPGMRSLTQSIDHLKPIPLAKDSTVNLALAALIAHMDLSKSLVFSEERMEHYRDSLYALWSKQNKLLCFETIPTMKYISRLRLRGINEFSCHIVSYPGKYQYGVN